jgi:SNF2 family DNA or RNA helicase
VLLQLLDEDGDEAFGMMRNWDKEKEALLAEYGFSLKDKWEHKFKFGLVGGKPFMTPLDKNLAKIGSTEFYKQLSSLQSITANVALKPSILDKKATVQKEEKLGYLLTLYQDPTNSKLLANLAIEPILVEMGKTGKATNIRKINAGYGQSDYEYLQYLDEIDQQIITAQNKLKGDKLTNSLKKQGIKVKSYSDTVSHNSIEPEHLSAAINYVSSIYRRLFKLLAAKLVFLNTSDSTWQVRAMEYKVSEEAVVPSFNLGETADKGIKFTSTFRAGEKLIAQEDIIKVYDYALVARDCLYPIKNQKSYQAIFFGNTYPTLHIKETGKEAFMKNAVYPLLKNFKVEMPYALDIQNISDIEKPLAKIFLEEEDNFLKITPLFEYGDKQVSAVDDAELIFEENNKFYNIKRNKDYERELHNSVATSNEGLVEDNGIFWLSGTDFLKNNWFLDAFEVFREQGFEILGFNNLKSFKYNQNRPTIQVRASSGIDWFDVKIEINFGDQMVNLKDVRKALLNKEHFVRLGDGTIGILPQEWIEKYSSIFKFGDVDKNGVKLSKIHFSLLDELAADIDNEKLLRELQEKKNKLLKFDTIKQIALPDNIQAQLRDYQQHGYQWLNFLDEFGWGGCLADDMGLGKTLQMLSFLKAQIDKHPDQTNLVVVPTSLVYNWAREIEKFVPDINYLVYYGTGRSKNLLQELPKYKLVITSYGILVNEIEDFVKFKFRYIVLDEAQAIKNVTSQRYKAVNLLQAYNKLTMTGTPVENNTSELFAQMNFVNTGMLGNYEFFKTEYGNEIDRYGNQERVQELKKLIYPFILRRTKSQVAKDLPEKTETVLYCEMNTRQRKVYEAFRNRYRDEIMQVVSEKGIASAGMAVLEGLLKLRQICDSPVLLNEKEKYAEDSTKLDELMTHVLEIAPKHKILIFSQFIGMLDLVKRRLHNHHIPYVYLDGQTQDRQALVENFQNNDSIRVFLMSLKAGGVGLNLTAAEYVFLIDPWWNPAVEQQAIDRTHRIGQQNKVFAYKMICKDTVEEKILKLQEKKKLLADDMISTETNVLKKLTKEDIQDLFS